MLVLVIALAGGLLAGLALGGSIGNLEQLRPRLPWAAVAALLLQIVAFSPLGRALSDAGPIVMHVSSYGLLLAFVAFNLRRLPIACFGLGVLSNAITIVLNGGYMPASAGALRLAGLPVSNPPHNNSQLAGAATHLRFLGDIAAVPHWLPLANVFSVGDMLIAIGLAWLIAEGMRPAREAGQDPADPAPADLARP